MESVMEIKSAWACFDSAALDRLEPLYSPHVRFIDPTGEINGRDALFAHLRHQCKDLVECRFEFDSDMETIGSDHACLVWNMILRHRKIGGGKEHVTQGTSLLRFNDSVVFHRDWFDLGEMVYEHLPVIGPLTRLVKGKMGYQQGN